jgi:lysophospholipase L1-like esterase
MWPEPIIRQPMDDIPATRKQTLTRRIWIALIILYVAGLHAFVGLALVKTDLAGRAARKLSAVVSPPPPEPAPASVAAPPPVRDYQKELAAIVHRDHFFYPLLTQFALTNLVPRDPVFFVGDSMVRGLNVSALTPVAVNLGLSGDNTAGTLHRIRLYPKTMPHFQTSRLLVISVGTNNLGLGPPADPLIARHVRQMLASRPREQRLVLNAIFPVDQSVQPLELAGYNQRIDAINLELQRTCAAFANCSFLNAGRKMRDGNGNLAAKYHKKNDAFHLSPAAYAYWVEELRAILPDLPAASPGSAQPGAASEPTAGLEPALPR